MYGVMGLLHRSGERLMLVKDDLMLLVFVPKRYFDIRRNGFLGVMRLMKA